MTNAGKANIPQIVAMGCYDLVDFAGWQEAPEALKGQEVHAHNRLLSSVLMTPDQRRAMAREVSGKLASAKAPVTYILTTQGGNEWDRPGSPLHDPDGLTAFLDEARATCPANVTLVELDAHINDEAFTDAVLSQFDQWLADGVIPRP
jgi:uncharacterized protein (UPF0261 family)